MPARITSGAEMALRRKPLRLGIFGGPKTVKTPTAFAYLQYLIEYVNPDARAAYMASDPGSEALPSIPQSLADHVDVFEPAYMLEKDYHPYNDAFLFALKNWKQDPNMMLMIWDTFTTTLQDIMQHNADTGAFAGKDGNKHRQIGTPGTAARMALGELQDYNPMIGIGTRLTRLCFEQNLDFIQIMHARHFQDVDKISRIGPAATGTQLVERLAGMHNGLIFTEKKMTPKGTHLFLHTESDGITMAGIRHRTIDGSPKNPIPTVEIAGKSEEDLVKFWDLFCTKFDFTTTVPEKEMARNE